MKIVHREFVKEIIRLQQRDGQVHALKLAEALNLPPSTVTETLKKLAAAGLINHVPYRAITLTEKGEREAIKSLRRHRIVERFLTDVLGFQWYEAHREALPFEHGISDEVEERLFKVLEQPKTCPHGLPIPSRPEEAYPRATRLYDLEPGEAARIVNVGEVDEDMLKLIEKQGLRPGTQLKVVEKPPFKGPITVTVDDTKRSVWYQLAINISVDRLPA
ncbi:MAG: metal-dependent transcriptional regulator [Actinobacteria bacterium]|nr:metal-dependent transcriptional regulator [Actinomycetota bacterium]